MDRVLRLSRFWQWIPYFRVVAETEHLPTASRMLGVSASALSRSVRLLEKEIGVALFARDGRRIKLTDKGAELLHAFRTAMRVTDDGLDTVRSDQLTGPLRVASSGVVRTMFVLPSLAELGRQHPRLEPQMRSCPSDEIDERLLRGDLDAAFPGSPSSHPALESDLVAELATSVYCGPGHPLAERSSVPRDEILDYEFVAALSPDRGEPIHDGWPSEVRRRVTLQADHISVGIEACQTLGYLAVLPDAVGARMNLRRIATDDLRTAQVRVFARRRRSIESVHRASEAIVVAVASALATDQHATTGG